MDFFGKLPTVGDFAKWSKKLKTHKSSTFDRAIIFSMSFFLQIHCVEGVFTLVSPHFWAYKQLRRKTRPLTIKTQVYCIQMEYTVEGILIIPFGPAVLQVKNYHTNSIKKNTFPRNLVPHFLV